MAAEASISRRALLFGAKTGEAGQSCIRPPGVTRQGLAACTGCGLCVDSCPTHIIGLVDERPSLDFSRGECNFCGNCMPSCPETVFEATGASRFAHVIAVGEGCLARNGVACQSCGDICPEVAIQFRPRTGGPFLPEVDGDICSGCGACVGICPAGAIHAREREVVHA